MPDYGVGLHINEVAVMLNPDRGSRSECAQNLRVDNQKDCWCRGIFLVRDREAIENGWNGFPVCGDHLQEYLSFTPD